MTKRLKQKSVSPNATSRNPARKALTTPVATKGPLTHHIAPDEILVVVANEGVYTFRSAQLVKVLKAPR